MSIAEDLQLAIASDLNLVSNTLRPPESNEYERHMTPLGLVIGVSQMVVLPIIVSFTARYLHYYFVEQRAGKRPSDEDVANKIAEKQKTLESMAENAGAQPRDVVTKVVSDVLESIKTIITSSGDNFERLQTPGAERIQALLRSLEAVSVTPKQGSSGDASHQGASFDPEAAKLRDEVQSRLEEYHLTSATARELSERILKSVAGLLRIFFDLPEDVRHGS